MRNLKFLGLSVVFAVVAFASAPVTASAQGGLHFVGFDEYAHLKARQIQSKQLARRQMHRSAIKMGPRGPQLRGQKIRAFSAGRMRGFRAGATATPAQKEFAKLFREQRQAIHAQVKDGKLTRGQARTQMQAWDREHRPE